MNRAILFPDRKTTTLTQLQTDTIRLVEQLGDGATIRLALEGHVFTSGANKIRHGLRHAPRTVQVIPMSNVAWWIPTKPDMTYVYVQTAGALTGDLILWV